MLKYANLLLRFYGEPLALLPSKIEAIARFLRLKASGEDVPPDEVAQIVAARRQEADVRQVRNGTAVIPVLGAISQRVGLLSKASGGVSAEEVGNELAAAVNDPDVRNILMVFDSPGGGVYGIDELAGQIRTARTIKPVVGIADSVAASAAYWLISQCSEVVVTPGGQVGSIGVYAAHEDCSAAAEQEGVKTTLVSAGKYKTEGNPFGPLSDEARAELQAKVDHYHGQFLDAVAQGRGVSAGTVAQQFGQGRMVTADAAVQRGMADRVATLPETLARLTAPVTSRGRYAAAAIARARAVEAEGGS